MTPEERDVLGRFLSDLQATGAAAKDPEADGLIADALRSNPDASYLLVQHAILADQALQAAQQRIEALQAPSPSHLTASFLGGQPAGAQPPQAYWESQPAPAPQSPLAQASGLNGFLRSAGTMAAGVAGGEFLAQGLSNLFSRRDW